MSVPQQHQEQYQETIPGTATSWPLGDSTSCFCIPPSIHDDDDEIFDFVMNDGIQKVASAILKEPNTVDQVQHGLSVLVGIANTNACHWRSIWGTLRMEGLQQLFETYAECSSIFSTLLEILIQVPESILRDAGSNETLRHWIPLCSLILEGMDCHFPSEEHFFKFCQFVRKFEERIPLEMNQRIRRWLSWGMHHTSVCEHDCLELVDEIMTRLSSRQVSVEKRLTGFAKKCIQGSYVPCAGAA
eukprot:Nitzschia sp. Nitz4//scaffold226_size53432//23316//24047//NITZ4_006699-RA/size53432-processed-gene-0.19-mRNA-1//1//CDS//3329542745//7164//frame0